MKYIKIKKTASVYRGKKAKYGGETIYPNGRHAVTAAIMTGGPHDTQGGIPIELNLEEVEFLFPNEERNIMDNRSKAAYVDGSIIIDYPGESAAGISSTNWEIQNILIPVKDVEEREQIRAAFSEAFNTITGGGHKVIFSDEIPPDPER